jgi:hypothetical protein
MMMTPALRRFAFTTHITSSIGWIGAPFGLTDYGKRKRQEQR